jgi:hypothetical protein
MNGIEPSILFGQKPEPEFGLTARGWDYYRDIKAICSELVASKGFPPFESWVKVKPDEKGWEFAEKDMRPEYEGLEVYEKGAISAVEFIRSRTHVTDDVNYALMIAERCAFILRVEDKLDRIDFTHYSAMHEIGELTVEAYWRKAFAADIVRGISILQAARLGGAQRKNRLNAKSANILNEMTKLVDAGRGVQDAAASCFRRRIGSSAGANRALWYRHHKNV